MKPKKWKMKTATSIYFVLMFLISSFAFAQGNFSQFFNAPLNINPANTGKFAGDYRVGGVYRNQPEFTSFQSAEYSFFADLSVLNSVFPETDEMAIGIIGHGKEDDFNGIKNSELLFSTAYFKSLNEDGTERIGAGFQVDFAHKRIRPPLLVFENQLVAWLNNGYTVNDPFRRDVIETYYVDVNVGLNYQKLLNKMHILSIGLSVRHINKPSKSYGDVIFLLAPELSLQLEFDKKIQNNNKLSFALIANDLFSKMLFDMDLYT